MFFPQSIFLKFGHFKQRYDWADTETFLKFYFNHFLKALNLASSFSDFTGRLQRTYACYTPHTLLTFQRRCVVIHDAPSFFSLTIKIDSLLLNESMRIKNSREQQIYFNLIISSYVCNCKQAKNRTG